MYRINSCDPSLSHAKVSPTWSVSHRHRTPRQTKTTKTNRKPSTANKATVQSPRSRVARDIARSLHACTPKPYPARNLSRLLASKMPSNPITQACVRRLHDSSGVRLRIPPATSKEFVKRWGRCSGTSPATQALRLPTTTPRRSTFLRRPSEKGVGVR